MADNRFRDRDTDRSRGRSDSIFNDRERSGQDRDERGVFERGGYGGGFGAGAGAGRDYGMRPRGQDDGRFGEDRHPQTVRNEPSSGRYRGQSQRGGGQDLGEGEYFRRGREDGQFNQGRFDGGRSQRSFGQDRPRDLDRHSTGFGQSDDDYRAAIGTFDQSRSGQGSRGGWHQDDHYRNWRNQQLAEFDRDYDEYRRERQQQFQQDFDSWRQNRQSQGRPGSQSISGDTQSTLTLGASQEVGNENEGAEQSQPTGASAESDATASGRSSRSNA